MLPLNNTDFWWLRYGLGLALPVPMALFGAYSIVARHSYVYWLRSGLVSVHGTQAVFAGVAYLGLALMFFSNCYLQYDEKAGFHYGWPLALGAIMTAVGALACMWLFIAG